MKHMIWFLVVSFHSLSAYSKDLSYSKRLALMMSVSSKAQLKSIDKEMTVYEEISAECKLQLESGKLPTKCFQQLQQEKKLKLIGLRRLAESQKVLAQICELRVSSIKDTDEIRGALKELDLKTPCAQKLQEALKRQEYQSIETEPLFVFEAIHSG
jgi:hypothetical protein